MDRKIGYEIREFQQLLNRRIEAQREASEVSLTHTQTRIVLFISKQKGPVFQRDIEKELSVRRSTATEMLNVLERDSIIERKRVDFDARLKEVVLTEKAKSFITAMKKDIQGTEALLRKNVDPNDLDVFFNVLDQIRENLR
ncbi:hypothetical protein AOC36_08965 [Erysipelothrix larvae]|uniref:HTH marR-type domain-containing protein n=1 Tax=Erysipelothrix larvae TaxID=1514105 RepID=A0A109UHG1_9FIRM|nr:MarR family transcriptional regulator [Erysipelothrix larvae]AMC94113.1 hypothetical protein AOC36_08965 [Erysipelothrix larvae]